MIPPTPTHLPAGTPHFSMPNEFSLWASTDTAIHTWNFLGDARIVIQAIVLILIVMAGMYIVNRFIHEFTGEDASE